MITVERQQNDGAYFTGERFEFQITEAEIELEHIHRYLMAARLINGGKVLDAACGSGYGSNILSFVAEEVHGIDISQQAIDAANAKYPRPNLWLHCCDATRLPFDDHSFDAVVSFETLEHLAMQEELLSGFKRVLKPNGLLIISTPQKDNYNNSLTEPNPFHVKELEVAEFKSLLARHFQNHTIVGQRAVFGSLISSGITNNNPLRVIRREDDGRLTAASAYDKAMYLIALCSDAPLPLPDTEIYEGSIPQNAMSSLTGGIEDRDRIIRRLRGTIDDLQAANARLSADTRLREKVLEALKGELADLRVELAKQSAIPEIWR